MVRAIVCSLALTALACGAQDAAPPPSEPAPTPAAPEAAPDRTATEVTDAEAVKEDELPTFDGDHAMAKTDALRASLSWLEVVDGGDYGGGWDAAAGLVQDVTSKEAFSEQVGGLRGSFGAVKSRTFASAAYAKQLPGAPDGEYVVIQYNTVFENKAQAVETITPMLDWDGTWKVSGYYVK